MNRYMQFHITMSLPSCSRLVFLAILGLAASSQAATFTVNPSADALVSSANAANNYGAAGALAVSAAGLPKGEFDSLLRFDFSAAKASFDATFGTGQWVINSMSLQLTLAAPNNSLFNGNGAGAGGTNVNFAGSIAAKWLQNDSWAEGTGTTGAPSATGITFATLPSFLGASDESLGSNPVSSATSGNIALSLGLTPSFVADATAGNLVSVLLLPGDAGVATVSNSRNGANVPVFTVSATAVPEPCASVLAAAGMLVSFARRRRHARKA